MSSSTIYFGYGSNLWLAQMALRCPQSKYLGVGMLNGWRLQINERGYCNVVELQASARSSPGAPGIDPGEVVYGLVFSLTPEDEASLDANEGVPYAYTKEVHTVNFWENRDQTPVDVATKPELVRMLVYVDRVRIIDSQPKNEYIYRMNMGVRDALKMGVPDAYIEKVIRKYIPSEEPVHEKYKLEAEGQAKDFQDR